MRYRRRTPWLKLLVLGCAAVIIGFSVLVSCKDQPDTHTQSTEMTRSAAPVFPPPVQPVRPTEPPMTSVTYRVSGTTGPVTIHYTGYDRYLRATATNVVFFTRLPWEETVEIPLAHTARLSVTYNGNDDPGRSMIEAASATMAAAQAPEFAAPSSEREVTFHCQIEQGAKKIASNEATSSARTFEVSCEGQVE
jgi:hypothetical protein